MWYLKKFLCCVHLYYGVLFISLSGLLLSIMVAIWIYLMDIVEKSLIIGLIAIFLLILYFLGKLFLIIGTITLKCPLVLMSFIVGLNTLVFVTIGMIVWFFHDFYITLPYVLATYYVILEYYHLWIVLSYWKVCVKCCAEHPHEHHTICRNRYPPVTPVPAT